MTNAIRDENHVPVALGQSSANPTVTLPFLIDPITGRLLTDVAGGGGTVTSVSVVTANGFAGTVTNPTTTPAITIETTVTGLLLGNGASVSAAPTTGSGSVVLANSPTFVDDITIGTPATATGAILLRGTTSGTVTLSVADAAGTWTMKLPTTAGNNGEFLQTDGSGNTTWAAGGGGGTVDSVVGTANRITVDSTDPANPIVDIAATYVGQTSITTLGTIGTGTWNGSVIAGQYGGTGVANTGKTITVSGNTTIGSNTDTVAFLTTGNTSVTLPTSGTLATTAQIPTNVVTAAATFATDESILRADGTSRGSQATGSNATLSDAGAMTLASTATASAFIPSGSSAPTNGVYLPAANTLGFAVNSTGEVQLTATALAPITNDGNALGTSSLGWSDGFFATGALIDFGAGNSVITHSSAVLTVSTGDLRVTTAGTNSASVVTNAGTQTLTNKRVQPRSSTAASGDITPDLATANVWQRTAISAGIAINAPTGTPVLGEVLVFMLLDDGTARALTWNSAFTTRPMGAALPTTTTISKQLLVTAQYNGSTWLALSVEQT